MTRAHATLIVAIVLSALAAPHARAEADAVALQASLAFDEPPRIGGTLAATATEALLNLSNAARAAGDAWRLSWDAAEGEIVEERGRMVAQNAWVGEPGSPEREQVAWGAGSMSAWTCADFCMLVLIADGNGALAIAGEAAGTLVPTVGEERHEARSPAGGALFAYDLPETRLSLGAGGALPLAHSAANASGSVRVILWGASVDVDTGGARTRLETGVARAPSELAPDVETVASRFAILHLQNARIDGVAPDASLEAARVQWTLDGSVQGARADGWLVLDGARHDVRDARVEVAGALAGAWAPGGLGGAGARATMRGDATLVRVNGAVLADARDADATNAALVAGAAVGILALVLIGAKAASVGLYSRIGRDDALRHPKRLAAFEFVRAHPGAHVSQLSRELGIRRVTLQHHLRILEAHRLVVARPAGRVLTYFAAGAAPEERALNVRVAMKDASRQRLVDALVEGRATGLSQADLVARTGMSQRLVSYHLQKLEALGLVRGDGGRPRRFVPAETLGAADAPEAFSS